MTTNDRDAEALLLNQTYFALDAKGFAAFQNLVQNPPAPTHRLRRTLTSKAPWDAMDVSMWNTTDHDVKSALQLTQRSDQ